MHDYQALKRTSVYAAGLEEDLEELRKELEEIPRLKKLAYVKQVQLDISADTVSDLKTRLEDSERDASVTRQMQKAYTYQVGLDKGRIEKLEYQLDNSMLTITELHNERANQEAVIKDLHNRIGNHVSREREVVVTYLREFADGVELLKGNENLGLFAMRDGGIGGKVFGKKS